MDVDTFLQKSSFISCGDDDCRTGKCAHGPAGVHVFGACAPALWGGARPCDHGVPALRAGTGHVIMACPPFGRCPVM